VEAGFAGQLLLSSDIFLKSLLRKNGGPGYGHIVQYFLPRLRRLGIGDDVVDQLVVSNPKAVFDNAQES